MIQNNYKEKEKKLTVYTLRSVNILRKYIGFADFFVSLLDSHIYLNFNMYKNYKAMAIHHSQFVWYRKLFVIFSRYGYINTLEKIR